MQTKTRIKWIRDYALGLSLLAHLLFLITLVTVVQFEWSKKPVINQQPNSVSAYTVAATPMSAAQPAPQPTQASTTKTEQAPPKQDKTIVLNPIKPKPQPKTSAARAAKPASKREITFSTASPPIDLTHPYDREPLRLIGESKIVQPLVRMLARAIGPHLFYPRVAAEFNLRGVVLVGFTLHPEGYITDTRIVKSSDSGVLDDAARSAVMRAGSIGNVSEFVNAPEFLVIGVIFG